jgi:hypothetical protein
MIGSPKPTSYESLMPPFVNPISSSPSNQSTGPSFAVRQGRARFGITARLRHPGAIRVPFQPFGRPSEMTSLAPRRSLQGGPGSWVGRIHSVQRHVTAGSRRNGTRFRAAPRRTVPSSARGLRSQTHPAERRTYLLSCFVASPVVAGGFDRVRRTRIAIRRCPRHPNGRSWPRMSVTRRDHCDADRQIQYRRYGSSPKARPAIPLFS